METLHTINLRQEALSAIATGLLVSTDPASLMNLRRGPSEYTIGQKAFCIFFQELLYESYLRKLPDIHPRYSSLVSARLKRIRASISIVTRMGALQTEQHISLDELAVLIPSVLGLVKGLLGGTSEKTTEFDAALKDMLTGDLLYMKELGIPEFVGTPFEIETSLW
jgi:hypothetical protein